MSSLTKLAALAAIVATGGAAALPIAAIALVKSTNAYASDKRYMRRNPKDLAFKREYERSRRRRRK